MSKSRNGHKEYSKEQRLIHENKKLKRQINHLRKQLARIDLDRYGHIKELLDQYEFEEQELSSKYAVLDKLKEEWKCHKCANGFLEIFKFRKATQEWYIRKCNSCDNRTSSQPYTQDVKGIIKDNT